MKKVIVSSILFGVAMTVTTVFAEENGISIQPISAAVPTLYAAPLEAMTSTMNGNARGVVTSLNTDILVPGVPEITSVSSVIEKPEIVTMTNLAKMKARGLQLIKERINSLQANAKPIANSKLLTADQKTAFAAFFSGKINDLTVLGSKIASSTDATSTKALVSSIYTDYRIYSIAEPQIRLQKRIYELQNHSAKLTEVFTKVQVRIDEFKAKGKDVSVWQKNLDDAKLLVASDTEKLPALLTKINALKPADYGTTSKMVIESVNKDVKSIAKNFQTIDKKVRRPAFLNNNKGYKKEEHKEATSTVR